MHRLTESIGGNDHIIGHSGAPVELVEYGDYECPYCARAHHEMTDVLRRVGGDLRYAFRHLPLTQIHRHALLAAQAAEAAGAQGRFWPMHSVLFENRHALEEGDLFAYAETLGLDVRRFARDLQAGTYLPKVERDFRSGVRSGVSGTPTFFVHGNRQDHGWDSDSLVAAIDAARGGPHPSVHR